MSQDFIHSVSYIQVAFRDSNGYPIGQETSPDSVAQDTTTHAYLLKNVVEFTPPEPSFARATDRGGMKIRAQVDMGVTDFGEASFQLSEFDDVFHAYITGSTVDSTSVSGWRQVGSNINKVAPPAFFVIISTQAYDVTNDTSKWSHWIMPNAQIRPTIPSATQGDGENPNPVNYTVTPNTSSRALTGELFSGMSLTLEDDKDLIYRMQTSLPIGITTYVEAGTPDGQFVLGYRPASDESTTTDKYATDEGSSTTISSCNTTTGAVTVTTADAGDRIVMVYETNYTAI